MSIGGPLALLGAGPGGMPDHLLCYVLLNNLKHENKLSHKKTLNAYNTFLSPGKNHSEMLFRNFKDLVYSRYVNISNEISFRDVSLRALLWK